MLAGGSLYSDDQAWSWQDLWRLADSVNQKLRQPVQAGEKILLRPESHLDGFIKLILCIQNQAIAIIDEKRICPETDARSLKIPQSWLIPSNQVEESVDISEKIKAITSHDELGVVVYTSGSTGKPKPINKSWRGLVRETQVLQQLYELSEENQSIVSLVSPFHIYGLLNAFLLPMCCGSNIFFPKREPINQQSVLPESIDLLVTVPAIWSLVKHYCEHRDIKRFVTSGAAFGEKRQNDLIAFPSKPNLCFEVLGSSETGGIAWRNLVIDSDFHLLSSVTLKLEEQTQISSDFIFPRHQILTITDRFEETAEKRYRYLGRSDRIFKLSGRRFSLGEVERKLATFFPDSEIYCQFFMDENLPQGGTLIGFVEGEFSKEQMQVSLAQFRQRFPNMASPKALLSEKSFPRDENGKIQSWKLKFCL